jgi:chromate transport protein ChrA
LTIYSFISLGFYGILYTLISRRLWIPAGILFILQYVGFAVYVVFRGFPSPVSLALGIAQTPSMINLFVLGLVAGSLSFGGAYTAIPFIQVEAVLKGGWLSQSIFIDCIAIGNVLPAPLVIFATFVGFQGGLADGGLGNAFAGAIVITLGMFSPCFLFTIAGHSLLEKLIQNKVCLSRTSMLMATAPDLLQLLSSFFDGLCGAVIGVIAIIAAQILQTSIEGVKRQAEETSVNAAIDRLSQSGPAAVLYVLALATLYKFNSKYSPLLLLVSGAIAGQFIFIS